MLYGYGVLESLGGCSSVCYYLILALRNLLNQYSLCARKYHMPDSSNEILRPT